MEQLFNEILTTGKAPIFRICEAYSTERDTAQDLFQEVLLQIWQSLSRFEHRSRVNTWAYRIAINVCMRAKYQAERRTRTLRLDSIHWQHVPDNKDTEEAQRKDALHAAIRQLNDTDKALILLYLEDLPYREIADITGTTENNIAVKIKRVKKKLLQIIKNNGYEG